MTSGASGGGGGETAKDVSAWTPDLIRALLAETDRRYIQLYEESEKRYEQRFIAQEKAVASALAAAKEAVAAALASQSKATDKAEADVERWRQANNEWRAAMLDRESKFVQTDTFQAEMKGVEAKIDELSKNLGLRVTSLEKSRDQNVGRSAAFGVALLVIFSIITLALRFIPG